MKLKIGFDERGWADAVLLKLTRRLSGEHVVNESIEPGRLPIAETAATHAWRLVGG
jgi:hypothetical protein